MSLNLSTAKADDIEKEIRILKAQIKRLEEKVAKQEHQIHGIAKSPQNAACGRDAAGVQGHALSAAAREL